MSWRTTYNLLDEGDAAACVALWAMSLQWSPSLQRLFHRGLARTRARPVSISVPTDLGAHRQYSFEHPYGFGERRFAPLALLTRQCFWIYIACGLPSYRVTRPLIAANSSRPSALSLAFSVAIRRRVPSNRQAQNPQGLSRLRC